ncbi:MAG: hypothetical protein KKD74_14065 [Bacteroidetes bacterium]|nr:hypothetical protein [Bacteroidota bacterium]
MRKLIKFGEDVEGFNIPVLNEREIRAAAGMLFLATFLSLMFIVFKGNFVPIKYVITFFLVDFGSLQKSVSGCVSQGKPWRP